MWLTQSDELEQNPYYASEALKTRCVSHRAIAVEKARHTLKCA